MARPTSLRRQSPRRSSPPPADPAVRALLDAAPLTAAQRTALARRAGAQGGAWVRAHPYRLLQALPDLPFAVVDTFARRCGAGKTQPARLQAGLVAVLQQALRQGHTGLPLSLLLRRASRLLEVSRTVLEEYCLRSVFTSGSAFLVEAQGTETFFTSRALRQVEEQVAERVAEHVSLPVLPLTPQADTHAAQLAIALGLHAEQAAALRSAVLHPLTIVTGGPGTGKSFFCRAVAQFAAQHQLPLLAGAPTGRAAQRLTELTGVPALTLHRMLEYDPHTQRFQRHAECPLDAALVLADEMSMVDVFLFAALLAAVPLGAHLVLVGDEEQLPSVGPGQVLADLLAADIAPVVRFTQGYRQTAGSGIAVCAQAIRAGVAPELTTDPQAECRLLEVADPAQGVARIVELVSEELPAQWGYAPEQIQVLCPLNQGEAGTHVLNQALQARLNPTGREILGTAPPLRVGDRVMVTQNNYRLGVFNGETGVISGARTRPLHVDVRTAQGAVTFVGPEVAQLTLGYAVSVHKAQGGEFPVVVVFLHDVHAPLLQRPVLYTALTRAQQRCVLVGTRTAVQQAVHTQQAVHRFTGLAAALQRACPHRVASPARPSVARPVLVHTRD